MTNPNDPCGPQHFRDFEAEQSGRLAEHVRGLSKREYFAALAMQGYLSNSAIDLLTDDAKLAAWSVVSADTLIAELNKEKK